MENTQAIKLIKDCKEILLNGSVSENISSITILLTDLREYAKLEERPVVVKSLRLVCEYLNSNLDFLVSIPCDDEVEEVVSTEPVANESLNYYLSLLLNLNNKNNISDLRGFNKILLGLM